MTKVSELPARIEGNDGFSIDIDDTGSKNWLKLAATDPDGESIEVVLPMGMVNALAGHLVSWVNEAVHGGNDLGGTA